MLSGLKLNKAQSVSVSVLVVVLVAVAAHFAGQVADTSNSSKGLSDKYLSQCKDEDCIKSGLEQVTKSYGTQKAIDTLGYYADSPGHLPGDSHERAHYIGYQTAKSHGTKAQAFLMCPSTFNYGCLHGFFIRAMEIRPKNIPIYKMADSICSDVKKSPNYSTNMEFYCYHGIGHAVMVTLDYHLDKALDACDKMSGKIGQTGCWQGVFMENVGGAMLDDVDNSTFSAEDPLAPCTVVAEKYKRECFINQHGHLFNYYNYDLKQASQACLRAGSYTDTCLEGIGLAASTESWQKILLGKQVPNDVVANTWLFCQNFPPGHIKTCVTGGVVQMLETDRFDYSRASRFCGMVSADVQDPCYRRIGEYSRLESADLHMLYNYCLQLPTKWIAACQEGSRSPNPYSSG